MYSLTEFRFASSIEHTTKEQYSMRQIENCLDVIVKLPVQYLYYVYNAKSNMALQIILVAVLVIVVFFHATNMIFDSLQNDSYLCK